MRTATTIKLPDDVVARNGLPSSTMTLRSSWQMEDGKIGLWLAHHGTQVWPVTDVTRSDAQQWIEDAQQPEGV